MVNRSCEEEIVQTLEALHESELKYRTLFETFRDVVYLTSAADGRIMECNDRQSGYTRDELLGKTTLELGLWANLEQRQQVIEQVTAHGFVNDFEAEFRRKDGSIFPGSMSCTPVTLKGEVFLLSVVRDISERIQLQMEREKAQRLESLGILAGGIAHDFNNILTGIIGNLSLIRLMLKDELKAAARLGECEKAAIRASALTQQLLTFAKGGEPVRKRVSLLNLIEEALSFVLHGSNVKGTVAASPDLALLSVDELQISQVFNNLLINAKQAMVDGGTVTITANNVQIHQGDHLPLMPGNYVLAQIIDEGHGISPDQLSRIFDPYFTTKANGTGLGLTTTYSIVRRHGGHIAVESEAGHGTVFSLYLPAAEDDTADCHGHENVTVEYADFGRILVMDDEEMIRDLAGFILTELGYDVDVCADGGEAVAKFNQARAGGAPYDAIILDLTVAGGMGGKEAAELIRAEDQAIALLVSSGYSDDPMMANYWEYGFNGAITKPYTLETFSDVLARVLRERVCGFG